MNPEEFRERLSERLKAQRPEFIWVLTEFIPCLQQDVRKVMSWFDDEWVIHEIEEGTTWPSDVTMADVKNFCGEFIPQTTKECNIAAIEFADKHYSDICEAILDEVVIDDKSENDC